MIEVRERERVRVVVISGTQDQSVGSGGSATFITLFVLFTSHLSFPSLFISISLLLTSHSFTSISHSFLSHHDQTHTHLTLFLGMTGYVKIEEKEEEEEEACCFEGNVVWLEATD